MLKATKSLSAGLRTLVIASAAEAPAEEKPVKDLRRFETLPPTDPSMGVPPSSSEGGVEAELSAAPEEPSALALQTAAYTAELLSHVERLKGRLTALEAINDEGARLQKALQQQEEEDSLKMMRFLRRQEEHYSVELVSKMKFVEEETERRVAREKEEEMDELKARHEADRLKYDEDAAQLQQMAEAAIEEARVEAAVETERRMQAEAVALLQEEHASHGARLRSLSLDVDALYQVLSHDTAYKEASHKTHQLTAGVLTVREALAGKATTAAAALRTLPKLAERLGDVLLVETFKPLQGKGADVMAKVPTVPQLTARFVDVAAAGRTAALVPETAPGLWGHALASITSFITLRAAETGHTHASTVLTTAETALARGDLRRAVEAVRALHGPSRAAASGWLEAAEERLLLEQILTVATAESTIATAALAPY
ncbi:hypothetical protein Ctob_011376 [Chrysochromulina tobinii]|uniref:MICOS complex subunit MIC60 n=1 Tax=Chrysochromulina tobinii TaxID=1460289 RepID=A0A0M0K327_9EUKA|nr:hypothetical protein Ctob_011376 [Chrysochromulina tobinii]|eukprot:KOO32977.1 hypothetical protein Ctob_011376 [Chrysochromulina sp. CCMP291]